MPDFRVSRPLTRNQLAKFLPNHEAIKAFEAMQDANLLFENAINSINAAIDLLENPPTIEVTANYDMNNDYYSIVVKQSGIIVTLPQAITERIGKIWTVNFDFTGSFNLNCFAGDSFPTPSNANETSALFNRRGMTLDFRCVAVNRWAIV